MAILSQRLLEGLGRAYRRDYGVTPRVMDLTGRVPGRRDALERVASVRRRRGYALQEALSTGNPCVVSVAPGVVTWVVALEDQRRLRGGLIGGEVRLEHETGRAGEAVAHLAEGGLSEQAAESYLRALPVWKVERVEPAAAVLQGRFYALSGWRPDLLEENRLRRRRQEQLNEALEDQRQLGRPVLYAFEKERMLLANIRAGNRNEARRLLNDMLAGIYMSSPELAVLRARTVELLSCLVRAAIEDNPLLEPLIERNHEWTERLVCATDFEALSQELMNALDDFMDAIYLQGVNRTNRTVSQVIAYIAAHFNEAISLRDVAAAVGLSPCRTAHLVKAFTGRTVVRLIHEARISRARKLLLRTDMRSAEIAYEVGFGDQSYFIKQFRRLTGITPTAFRRAGS